MGCVVVTSHYESRMEGVLVKVSYDKHYYLYCDRCGSWEIKASRGAATTVGYGVEGVIQLPGCILLLFAPPIGMVYLLITSLLFKDPSEKDKNEGKSASITCISCGAAWQGVEGRARPIKYRFDRDDVPTEISAGAVYNKDYSFSGWKFKKQ